MSEKVLQAIIQLMATSATIDGVQESEKEILRKFLWEHLSEETAEKYMKVFDGYVNQTEAMNTTQIVRQINAELTSPQKIVVISNLLEMTLSDGDMSLRESNYVDTIAEMCHLDKKEYQLIKNFIISPHFNNVISESCLVLIGSDVLASSSHRYIFREKLDEQIAILRIPSQEMYLLKYLGNQNIYLNGISLKKHQIYNFSVGSSLRGDKIEPIFYSDIVSLFLKEQKSGKISFEANTIWYRFANRKLGLRNINIAEESGKLIGLMGASGSGKSTLLNVLNGNYAPSKGKVLINGIDVHKEAKRLNGVIGYVPQDDLLIEELTVYQNLYYAAKLCFSHFTEEEIDYLVSNTLQNLGLLETADLKVGNVLQKTISGGQRKRLNIGLELLREPAVLFVDEPTSGLSSQDSENIMDLLKELSLKGKLIFVVIHQPSSDIFKMFDKLFILDVGGYPIYYGNPIEAITYFKRMSNMADKDEGICMECGNVNPEQIFSIIETKVVNEFGRFTNRRKVSPKKWNEYYQANITLPKVQRSEEPPKKSLYPPSRFTQWAIYLTRDLLSKLSNTQYLSINLLEAPLLAFILAYIVRYYQIDESEVATTAGYLLAKNNNLPTYIFMSIIVALFIGLTVSAEEIIKDAKMLKRESFLQLSRLSYLTAKITLLFGFSAVQTLCYVLIGNWILEIESMTFTYWIVLFSSACFANLLGLNISSTFNSAITIYILIPILLIPQLVLGGIVVRFDEINPKIAKQDKVPFVGDLMASRWAFEAITVSQFKNNTFEKYFYGLDQQMAQAEYYKAIYLPVLETKLVYAFENKDRDSLRPKVESALILLSHELKKINQQNTLQFNKNLPIFNSYQKLHFQQFNAAAFEQTKKYLQDLKSFYTRQYNQASSQKDKIISQYTQTPLEREEFINRQQKHHNEAIAKLVTNTESLHRIIETKGKLIQKVYPIYKTPEPDYLLDFRTHFFAPKKYFAGYFFDTLWFNIAMIWFMIFVLSLTLQFDFFRKIITQTSIFIKLIKQKYRFVVHKAKKTVHV